MPTRNAAALIRLLALPAFLLAALPTTAHAWSHQGHMLLSRLAALRIIEDPQAPAELRAFLKSNMTYTLNDCRQLAVGDFLGANPAGKFITGIDGAATFPDRVQQTESGKQPIQPYNLDEGRLHFLDLEFFSPIGDYRDDLSALPKKSDIPQDVHDPRFKLAGFVPFRLEESYGKLTQAFGAGGKPMDSTQALVWLGYTVHYAQDIHQPQHGTADYKSLSYLAAAKIPGVRTITRELSDGRKIQQFQVDRDKTKLINPHGDIEFQLFENSEEPRLTFRKQYWDLLLEQIDAQSKNLPATLTQADKKPIFDLSIDVLLDSYHNLPLIGHAAQAAYKTGVFDPAAFFPFRQDPQGPSILDMIARQNARAVLLSEILIRRAWMQAHINNPS